MAVELGLGGVGPNLPGRVGIVALTDCAANRKPDRLAVVAEGASQRIGPGHPIVVAPVALTTNSAAARARAHPARAARPAAWARRWTRLRPSGPCVRQPRRTATGSCCRRRGSRPSSAGVTSGSLAGSVSSSPPRARSRAGPVFGCMPATTACWPAPSTSTMCRWPSISTMVERDRVTGSVTCTGTRNLGAFPTRQTNSPGRPASDATSPGSRRRPRGAARRHR